MRFASREKPSCRTSRSARDRARREAHGRAALDGSWTRLEVLLGADDVAETSRDVGYFNRYCPMPNSTPSFEAPARIASFDKQALAETKRLVNLTACPPMANCA